MHLSQSSGVGVMVFLCVCILDLFSWFIHVQKVLPQFADYYGQYGVTLCFHPFMFSFLVYFCSVSCIFVLISPISPN